MLDKAINDKRSKLNKEKGCQLLGAVADWATGKSKALKGDIEDLKLDLAEAHEAIAEERKRTQAETAKLEAYKKTVAQQMESAVRNAVLCRLFLQLNSFYIRQIISIHKPCATNLHQNYNKKIK